MKCIHDYPLIEMSKTRKRRHHFVPRFHLRFFSDPSSPGTIALWNLNRQQFISKAAISNQAYEIDLYGIDNQIEDALAILESRVSIILSSIKDSNVLPMPNSEDSIWLYLYIMFQAERTKASAKDVEGTMDQMMKNVFKDDPRVKEYLPHFNLRMANAAPFKLALLAPMLPLIFDLKPILFLNESDHDFIISDNPVVRYNQFTEVRMWPGSGGGWANPGLQIFFPISPKTMLLLYDSDLYEVGNESTSSVVINTLSDINWLNGLQYIIAEENVYFSPQADEIYAMRMHRRWAGYRKPRFSVQEIPESNPDPKSTRRSSLIVSSLNDVRLGLDLSFLRFKINPESRKLGPTMWNPRNPYVESIIEEIYKDRK